MDDKKQETISMLDSFFYEFWDNHNVDIKNIDTIKNNTFNSSMNYIYDNYVAYKRIDKSKRSIENYIDEDIITIVSWFKQLVLYYNIVSIYGLCLLFGISKNNLYYITSNEGVNEGKLTNESIEALKSIFELYQENAIGKLNDSPVGLITNANNNVDMGLTYNKQNLLNHQIVKQFTSIEDLPKLE